jgi:hypothetical protein
MARISQRSAKLLQADLNFILLDAVLPSFPTIGGEFSLSIWAPFIQYNVIYMKQMTIDVGYPGGSFGYGSILPASKGIVGCAYRAKCDIVELLPYESFRSVDRLRDRKVSRWGFTQEEAKAITPNLRFMSASPIMHPSGDQVVAVVFFGAKEPDPLIKALDNKVGLIAQQIASHGGDKIRVAIEQNRLGR